MNIKQEGPKYVSHGLVVGLVIHTFIDFLRIENVDEDANKIKELKGKYEKSEQKYGAYSIICIICLLIQTFLFLYVLMVICFMYFVCLSIGSLPLDG